MKLENSFVKGMDPRQKRYEAVHADDFKEEIVEKIAERFCTVTLSRCRTIA
jgi:hypothetical protein